MFSPRRQGDGYALALDQPRLATSELLLLGEMAPSMKLPMDCCWLPKQGREGCAGDNSGWIRK